MSIVIHRRWNAGNAKSTNDLLEESEQITSYFIFANDDENDGMRGAQMFDGENKLAVRLSVKNGLPGRDADFLTIANQSASRQQFLQSQGNTLDLQNDRWQICIVDYGIERGEQLDIVSDAPPGSISYSP